MIYEGAVIIVPGINIVINKIPNKVSIVSVLFIVPLILIADEPTGNLDPTTSMEVMEILDQINKRCITIIVSTHDHTIVNHYRKRVITLDGGEIIKDIEGGTYDL